MTISVIFFRVISLCEGIEHTSKIACNLARGRGTNLRSFGGSAKNDSNWNRENKIEELKNMYKIKLVTSKWELKLIQWYELQWHSVTDLSKTLHAGGSYNKLACSSFSNI